MIAIRRAWMIQEVDGMMLGDFCKAGENETNP